VIFIVAVVFPIVITFSVAGILAGHHAQAAVPGFFPWSSPSALTRRASRAGRCAPVNNVPAPQANGIMSRTLKETQNLHEMMRHSRS